MGAQELQEKLLHFSTSYFLVDVRNDRDAFYALTAEDFEHYPFSLCGYILNLMIDGKLQKVDELISQLPDGNAIKSGLLLVHPKIDCHDFIKTVNYIKERNIPTGYTTLTAGRPYLLNGFNDFSRLGPLLQRRKNDFLDYIHVLYGSDCTQQIYNLCLAEYYYQTNKLVDSELIVAQTIRSFIQSNEPRFIFVALYLEARIAHANGTIIKSLSFIKDIRERIGKLGKAEFSNNIDAADTLFSLYSGNYERVQNWLMTDAPDEVGDFNMLDLYRYMVKIRCYIIQEEQSSAIALIEKLRPLLEEGRRHMDLCELDLLLTEALWSCGKKELALVSLERAMKIARRRNYLRLVADEGVALFEALSAYVKTAPESAFLASVIELTRRMAILYPLYLKPRYKNNEQFSQQEVDFLLLLEQGKGYEEIADFLFISLNTVRYHIKKIYSKLEADNANQAVWKAKLLGLIK